MKDFLCTETLLATIGLWIALFGLCDILVQERSGVYWKPKGAAARKAGPSTIPPHQTGVARGRCHAVDFGGRIEPQCGVEKVAAAVCDTHIYGCSCK